MNLPDRALCQERLGVIFPRELPLRGRLTNQLAASAVFTCLYVGAVGESLRIRPSMVLWMCDAAAARSQPSERSQWYQAARRGKRYVADLLTSWGQTHRAWYADNTREPLRDETFRSWHAMGAMLRDESVPTTSSKPQWSLAADFAGLFDPALADEALAEAIDDWRDDHIGTVGRARIALARRLASVGQEVIVALPGGQRRSLAAGGSSLILQGVIEQFASRALGEPAVLFISESRRHLDVVDAELLSSLGLDLDEQRLLPDALLFDVRSGTFWFVEAVFTDGAIDEGRKAALEAWAARHDIASSSCRFLTAFTSRNAVTFRRLASSLAVGSFAWFLDEPDLLVALRELATSPSASELQ